MVEGWTKAGCMGTKWLQYSDLTRTKQLYFSHCLYWSVENLLHFRLHTAIEQRRKSAVNCTQVHNNENGIWNGILISSCNAPLHSPLRRGVIFFLKRNVIIGNSTGNSIFNTETMILEKRRLKKKERRKKTRQDLSSLWILFNFTSKLVKVVIDHSLNLTLSIHLDFLHRLFGVNHLSCACLENENKEKKGEREKHEFNMNDEWHHIKIKQKKDEKKLAQHR